jgi:DNA-binding LacI/PurR family transcriptional regulator/ribosomal protein S25
MNLNLAIRNVLQVGFVMRSFHPVSLAEQVAAHIRREILQGTLGTAAPGVHRLAAELGVHHTTAEEALRMLEKEGLLVAQGPGRRRLIRTPDNFAAPSMRVGILPYEESDRTLHFLLDMQHKLQDAGHSVGFASKTLHDLGMDAKRLARFAKDSEVDAWVIVAGPRGVLEWFADQATPAFSLFGRRRNVPIASTGPDKLPALLDSVDRLVELGHRGIVMLLREEHRKPQPGFIAQALLDAMEAHGLQTGPYNLPDWENNAEDLRRCLDSLFSITPPSALIVDEAFIFNVAQQHLARRGILAPQHVSLICADPDPTFEWFSPSIAHVRWDSRMVTRRVVRWANNVARGKEDIRQSLIKAEFIEGGTIGPAPGMRG